MSFLSALAKGGAESAYALTSSGFRDGVTLSDFERFFAQFRTTSWKMLFARANRLVTGPWMRMIAVVEDDRALRYTVFVHVDGGRGEWKVCGLRVRCHGTHRYHPLPAQN